MTDTYRIDLPWSIPPISLNDRRNRWAHARAVRDVRAAGGWLARHACAGPFDRVRVELHYQPATRRARDSDNLVATLKPLVDGLVDAGVVRDDTDELVERVMPTIHEPVKEPPGRLWLIVTVLDVPSPTQPPAPTDENGSPATWGASTAISETPGAAL